MNTEDNKAEKCPECNALKGHSITCSLQSVEEKAAQTMIYYNAWLHAQVVSQRLKAQVTFWQGKHAMLRHENNKLRKRLKAH